MDIDRRRRFQEILSYKEMNKRLGVFQNYVIKCKCSHSILFTGRKDRIICSHCGNYVYRDKKVEMKYKIKELLK